jgi:hypothetical protein
MYGVYLLLVQVAHLDHVVVAVARLLEGWRWVCDDAAIVPYGVVPTISHRSF